MTVRDSVFSTGFCFFYWAHWKDIEEQKEQYQWNRNDFGGFQPKALFIEAPKYANLKREVLANAANKVSARAYEKAVRKATKMSVTK